MIWIKFVKVALYQGALALAVIAKIVTKKKLTVTVSVVVTATTKKRAVLAIFATAVVKKNLSAHVRFVIAAMKKSLSVPVKLLLDLLHQQTARSESPLVS